MYIDTTLKRRWVSLVGLLGFLLALFQTQVRADINITDLPDLHPEVAAVFAQAWQAYQEKRYLDIIPLTSQALAKSREVGDKAGEALSLFAYSELYKKLGATEKAAEYEAQARTVIAAGGNKAEAARIVMTLGSGYVALGQERSALEYYQQALKLYRELGDKQGQAACLLLLGNIQQEHLDQLDTGRALYRQALELSRAAGDHKHEAEALYYLGSFEQTPAESMNFYQQALAIARKAGDRETELRALYRVAQRHQIDHEPQKKPGNLSAGGALTPGVSREAGQRRFVTRHCRGFPQQAAGGAGVDQSGRRLFTVKATG